MFDPNRKLSRATRAAHDVALLEVQKHFPDNQITEGVRYINNSGANFQTINGVCDCGESFHGILIKDYRQHSTIRKDRFPCSGCAEYGYRHTHKDGGYFYIAAFLSAEDVGFGITHRIKTRRNDHRKNGVELTQAFHHPDASVAENIERQLKVLVRRDSNRPPGFITEALPLNFLDIILSLVTDAGMLEVTLS